MKKPLIIFSIILLIIILVYFGLKKLYPMMEIKLAIKKALKSYDKSIVENAERIYRKETRHFQSGQFLGTYSAGMEKFSDTYPYGWLTLHKKFWSLSPLYKPTGLKTYTENNTGIKKTFIKFPNFEAGFMTLCAFLEINGNRAGRWYSTNPDSILKYTAQLMTLEPKITNEVYET